MASRVLRSTVAVVVFLCASASHAIEIGRADGSITIKGVRYELRLAYGSIRPYWTAKPSPRPKVDRFLVLLLASPMADKPIDQIPGVQVELNAERKPIRAILALGEFSHTISGSAIKVQQLPAAEEMMHATVSGGKGANWFAATFHTTFAVSGFGPNPAVDAERERLLRQALNDPVRAYLAYQEAWRTGNREMMQRLATPEVIERYKNVEFGGWKPPRTIKILNSSITGNEAKIVIEEKGDSLLEPDAKLIATMRLDAEGWKYVDEVLQGEHFQAQTLRADEQRELPSDGWEPGTAWRIYTMALAQDDLDLLKGIVVVEWARKLEDPKAVARLKASRPEESKVTGGHVHGARATLRLQGVRDGKTISGMAIAVKQGDIWRLASEHWVYE